MATLTWHDGETLRLAELATGGATTVGRRADANVVVANDTVSRLHFIIRPTGDGFVVENQSQSTDTRVGGRPIAGATPLSDGDVLEAGSVTFQVHDLARSIGHQEIACSHCQKGNGLERRECWFCGTSLVNAPTAGFKVARPWARLAGARGSVTLYSGQAAVLGSGGGLEAGETGGAAVLVAGDVGPVVPANAPGPVTVNGKVPEGPVAHGSTLQAGGEKYLVLTRP